MPFHRHTVNTYLVNDVIVQRHCIGAKAGSDTASPCSANVNQGRKQRGRAEMSDTVVRKIKDGISTFISLNGDDFCRVGFAGTNNLLAFGERHEREKG